MMWCSNIQEESESDDEDELDSELELDDDLDFFALVLEDDLW